MLKQINGCRGSENVGIYLVFKPIIIPYILNSLQNSRYLNLLLSSDMIKFWHALVQIYKISDEFVRYGCLHFAQNFLPVRCVQYYFCLLFQTSL